MIAHTVKAHTYLLLIASTLLNGCGGSELTSDPGLSQIDLVNGRTWELTSYTEQNTNSVQAQPDYTIRFLLFNETNLFSGFDGCNTFSSQQLVVEDENQRISSLDGINVDGLFCENLQFSEYLLQFDVFYSALSSPFNYRVRVEEGGMFLRITSDNGTALDFVEVTISEAM